MAELEPDLEAILEAVVAEYGEALAAMDDEVVALVIDLERAELADEVDGGGA